LFVFKIKCLKRDQNYQEEEIVSPSESKSIATPIDKLNLTPGSNLIKLKSPFKSTNEKSKEGGGLDLIDLEEKKTEEKEGQNYLFDLLDFGAVNEKNSPNTGGSLDGKEKNQITSQQNDDLVNKILVIF
jgi:hypothetical protein